MIPIRRLRAVVLTGAIALSTAAADARDYFVNNLSGRDDNSGEARDLGLDRTGPFLTLRKALSVVQRGESITLENTGTPYYESIELTGPRFSGTAAYPLTINGGGATLSGSRMVPPTAWKYEPGISLWRFRPHRKGWYQLILNSQPLPEIRVAPDAPALPELAPGQWATWKGDVWYRAKVGASERPPEMPLEFAYESVGISLTNVEFVVIRDLTIQHFRQDGINAHDRARTVILDRVKLVENGRAGLAVSGASLVGLRDSTVEGNRDVQILNAEMAQTELLNVLLPDAPGIFRITGGHVLRDRVELPRQ